jgi:hypothetical protein
MTEALWVACADPQRMLDFLRGKAGERKARLSICALARRAWPVLSDDGRRAVGVAERLADGLCGEAERLAAYEAAGGDWSALYTQADGFPAKALVAENLLDYCFADAAASALQVADGRGQYILEVTPEREAAESAAQCDFLRCIFGNPFRAVSFSPGLVVHPPAVAAGGGVVHVLARLDDPLQPGAVRVDGVDRADRGGGLDPAGTVPGGVLALPLLDGEDQTRLGRARGGHEQREGGGEREQRESHGSGSG